MIAINDVYTLANYIAKKQLGVGYLAPSEFNRFIMPAVDGYIQTVYGMYEVTQKVTDDLDEIKTYKDYTVPSDGLITVPTNYRHMDSIRSKDYGTERYRDVELVSMGEATMRESSELLQPSKLFPIAYQYEDKVQFLPKNIGFVKMRYIRNPLIPFWNYTVSSGRSIYAATGGVATNPNAGVTAGNSTNIELPSYALEAVTLRVCSLLGISINDQALAQYSEALKNQNIP